MSKKKKIIIWVIIILAVMAVGFGYMATKKPATQYTTETVARGILAKTVSVTGTLKSDTEINLNFEQTGRIGGIDVKEGQAIAAGEKIASLNDATLGQQLEKSKATLDKAKADAVSRDDSIREAKKAVKNSKDALENTEKLEDEKVEAAEESHENAKDYYNDAKEYYDATVDSSGADSSTAKSARLTMTTAENSMKSAEKAIETAKRAQDLAIISAENAVHVAEEQLKSAQSSHSKESKDAAVAAAEADYEIAMINVGQASLVAPVSGIITEVNYKSGEILSSAALGSTPFAKMVSHDLIMESNVPESDIVDVKEGQTAVVTFDSLSSNDEFAVQVLEIDPASTVIQDVVYYRVTFTLNRFDERLKPGMSADIDIQVDEKQNALMIPQRAVKNEGGVETAEVLDANNQARKVEITTGLKGDEGMVEVVRGLNEGDKVVTLTKEK